MVQEDILREQNRILERIAVVLERNVVDDKPEPLSGKDVHEKLKEELTKTNSTEKPIITEAKDGKKNTN